MEKEEEIIKPIEKDVKRPFMRLLSKITIPLAITLLAIFMFLHSAYSWDLNLARTNTAEDWKNFSTAEEWEVGDYAGCSSFEEYKEKFDEKYSIKNTILLAGLASAIVGFVSRNAYKAGQED